MGALGSVRYRRANRAKAVLAAILILAGVAAVATVSISDDGRDCGTAIEPVIPDDEPVPSAEERIRNNSMRSGCDQAVAQRRMILAGVAVVAVVIAVFGGRGGYVGTGIYSND